MTEKKVKIFYIITQSFWGGAQKYVHDLATNLDADKYDITIGTGINQTEGYLNDFLKEYPHIRIKKFNYLLRGIRLISDLAAILEIFYFINKEKFDIIHLNSSKAGFIGSIAAKMAGCKKVIYTAHGLIFNETVDNFKKKLYFYLEKASGFFKDIIIVVSEYDYKIALENKIFSKEKMIVIHNGIESINFLDKKEAREKLNKFFNIDLRENDFIVGTIANFYPTKGLIFFIDAISIIIEKYPFVRFLIMGDGEQREILENKIEKKKLTAHIFMLGKVKWASLYMKAFDIFGLSSLKEGLPYVLLEAGLAGIPIVTTKVGGTPEIINNGNTGFLVDAGDFRQLAEKIIKVIDDYPQAQKMGENLSKKVKKEFHIQKMLEKTFGLYEK